jgi:NAD(P)-dependent dehydrogenase (short-subunit alcohol dehydrogenase family)
VCPGWIDTTGGPGALRREDHEWHWTGALELAAHGEQGALALGRAPPRTPGPMRLDARRRPRAGSVGRPEDVAALVAFLADPSKSGFITGQAFTVDGGVSKKMVYPE